MTAAQTARFQANATASKAGDRVISKVSATGDRHAFLIVPDRYVIDVTEALNRAHEQGVEEGKRSAEPVCACCVDNECECEGVNLREA